MTSYLLDTTTLIDFSKRHEPVHSRLRAMIRAGETLGICPVQITEFYGGVPLDQHPVWDAFFAALLYWDISRAAAVRAGIYRYTFARRGQAIATSDALIAGVAWQLQATVITSNARHFPMPDVRLLSLRD